MLFRTLQEIADLCDMLNGIAVSFPGYGNCDEIRVACIEDAGSGKFYANRILHGASGFSYGGESGCISGYDAGNVLGKAISQALGLDDDGDAWETVFEVNGLRELHHPSIPELIYGSEAWNAYDRGIEVR